MDSLSGSEFGVLGRGHRRDAERRSDGRMALVPLTFVARLARWCRAHAGHLAPTTGCSHRQRPDGIAGRSHGPFAQAESRRGLRDGRLTRPSRRDRTQPWVDLVHHLVDVGGVLTYNIHEAKTHFSRLLARVAAGEEVLIAKAGEPIAKIVPVRARTRRIPDARPAGLWVAEDFDAELPPELLDDFSGGR